jgi:hypothetical protein
MLISSCKQEERSDEFKGTALQIYCVQKLTDVIVYDIFSPPVASRIYGYANLAYYEALRPGFPGTISLIKEMNGFGQLDSISNGKQYDFELSATVAFMKVAQKLVFSKDSLKKAEKELMKAFNTMQKPVYERSVLWGESVARIILERAAKDNYSITRSMPRFSAFKEKGIWIQTPPDYADALEPYWKMISPLLMDSASQFKPPPPYPYNMEKSSPYYKELMEVYETSKKISGEMDTIAIFWDDNPFVSQHIGHLTYANKKMTPVGHWMGITSILCKEAKKDGISTARAFAITSAAIFDGFISCWDEKFRSKTLRPITVIREQLESEWNSLLQTPPFPEYTSGHSVISAAAATVLTRIFGEGFAFKDSSEMEYLGLKRSFKSIEEASDEAGISRLYGGIHFRSAIDNGKGQGIKIGELYNRLIR